MTRTMSSVSAPPRAPGVKEGAAGKVEPTGEAIIGRRRKGAPTGATGVMSVGGREGHTCPFLPGLSSPGSREQNLSAPVKQNGCGEERGLINMGKES